MALRSLHSLDPARGTVLRIKGAIKGNARNDPKPAIRMKSSWAQNVVNSRNMCISCMQELKMLYIPVIWGSKCCKFQGFCISKGSKCCKCFVHASVESAVNS